MAGKKYFYAIGQRARAKGMPKLVAENLYLIGALPYARIAFDKGYRGLGI